MNFALSLLKSATDFFPSLIGNGMLCIFPQLEMCFPQTCFDLTLQRTTFQSKNTAEKCSQSSPRAPKTSPNCLRGSSGRPEQPRSAPKAIFLIIYYTLAIRRQPPHRFVSESVTRPPTNDRRLPPLAEISEQPLPLAESSKMFRKRAARSGRMAQIFIGQNIMAKTLFILHFTNSYLFPIFYSTFSCCFVKFSRLLPPICIT